MVQQVRRRLRHGDDKVTSHGKPVSHEYDYTDPAWAKSDDEFTRPSLRTYSDWRGYRKVTVTKGGKSSSQQGDPQAQSYSVTRYFQGIGGEVKDSTGTYTLLRTTPRSTPAWWPRASPT